MKTKILIIALIFSATLNSQTKNISPSNCPPVPKYESSVTDFKGRLSLQNFVNNKTYSNIRPIDLLKSMEVQKTRINFSYSATSSSMQDYMLLDIRTSLKHNGELFSKMSRIHWPFPLKGEKSFTPELFDFIPSLEQLLARGTPTVTYLPKGTYEIMLDLIPSGSDKSSIPPAIITFNIN
jgi:hypothetical protein